MHSGNENQQTVFIYLSPARCMETSQNIFHIGAVLLYLLFSADTIDGQELYNNILFISLHPTRRDHHTNAGDKQQQ